MGLSFSCPFSHHCDLDSAFESVLKSITLGNDQPDKFKSQDFDTMISQPSVFGEHLVGTPVSCGPTKGPNLTTDNSMGTIPVPDDGSSLLMNSSFPEHAAALKLQKVYKSFRTRRKLADCAVLIEQTWWKLLDFAELKHSSISFFEIDKHETAISRWSRARTRAAKVGKGLSKNCKARKLALQHWLEAIDPRHRYGHNLHFYYIKWLNSQSKEPFFYWLDIGEGKEVNLIEKCSRWKLQQQCIKYLGPVERKAYKVVVEGGKLVYKQTRELVDTPEDAKGSKWIFVLSATRSLYVGKKAKGSFQHSSFLAGGATLAAGRIVAEKGVLKAVWPHSGHYRPTPENFKDLVSFLQDNNVDLTGVELESTVEDEEGSIMKQKVARLQSNSSEDELAEKDSEFNSMEMGSMQEEANASMKPKGSSTTHDFIRQLTALEIPSNENFLHNLMRESQTGECTSIEMDENAAAQHEIVPEESILHRINSRKELRSYQLGKQLSCKWSTGAGPRIGCLRDYPSGLQTHALEQVNLSPRRLKLDPLSRASSTPVASNLCRTSSRGSPLQQSSLLTLLN